MTIFDVIASSADEYDRFTKNDRARWAKLLKQVGIKPE
jgi:homospermidine synthase